MEFTPITRTKISPSQLRSALPALFKEGYEQHDCSEFSKFLLDRIEHESKTPQYLDDPAETNLVAKHFEGRIESTVTCGTCSSRTTRTDPFVDL